MSVPYTTSLCRFTRIQRPLSAVKIKTGLRDSPARLERRGFSAAKVWREEGKRETERKVDGIYDDLTSSSQSASQSTTPTPSTSPAETEQTPQDRARILFGSRLAGPAERQLDLDSASKTIAGVLVPPKPTEPDNCCMSGCVNCVWDRYQDEVDEWARKSGEARMKLEAMAKEEGPRRGSGEAQQGGSMDDDGGGSEGLWAGGDDAGFLGKEGGDAEDFMQGVPVGIREFMRNERRLKEKKAAAAAVAATAPTTTSASV